SESTGLLHSFASASRTSFPVATSRIRISAIFEFDNRYATRRPSCDGEGVFRCSRPLVMRIGSPVVFPVAASIGTRQILAARLFPTSNAIIRPSWDAEGEKLKPAPTVIGVMSPDTLWDFESNETR